MYGSPVFLNHLAQDFSSDEVEGSNESRKGFSQTTMTSNSAGYFKRPLISGQRENRLGMKRCQEFF
jgi:hypothetical protein